MESAIKFATVGDGEKKMENFLTRGKDSSINVKIYQTRKLVSDEPSFKTLSNKEIDPILDGERQFGKTKNFGKLFKINYPIEKKKRR